MRSGRGIAVAALGCAILTHGRARAQEAHLQGVLAASVGITDNVTSAPEPAGGGAAAGPEADGFGTVSPGLLFSYNTPRTSQTLSYTFTGSFFFLHSEASSYSNMATWSGRFVLSPTSTLTLGASGSQGQLNTFQLEQAATAGTLDGTPGGTTMFVQGSVNEGFSKQLSPVWTVGQAASFLVYSPLEDDAQRTYTAGAVLSAQRQFQRDVGALALSVNYTHFDNFRTEGEAPADPAEPTPVELSSRDQLLTTLVASWQHSYGHHLSHQIDVGGTVAADLGGELTPLLTPALLAALRYTHEQGEGELAYSYAAAPNVFLQQIQTAHLLRLRAAVPVRQAWHLWLEGSAGIQISQPIEPNEQGELARGRTTTAVSTDAALVWSPILPIPDFSLALRYQHSNQHTPEDAGAPGTRLVRNAVLVTVAGAFPRTEQTGARIMMTQPFGSAGPEGARGRAPRGAEPAADAQSAPPPSAD